MNPQNCPAAHSMDTTWYALDADGYVAEFISGEGGAVPNSAAVGPEAGDFDSWPLQALALAEALVGGRLPEQWREKSHPDALPSYPVHAIVLLGPGADEAASYRHRSDRPSLDELMGEDLVALRPGEPTLLTTTRRLPNKRLAELVAHPRVNNFVTEDAWWDWDDMAPATHYRFENLEWGDPGNYQRVNDPNRPTTSGPLPEDARKALVGLTLPVRFAETRDVHLADHLPDQDCSMWGDTTLRGQPLAEPARRSRSATATGRTRLLPILLALIAISACFLGWWFR